jgi:hypothetical protein
LKKILYKWDTKGKQSFNQLFKENKELFLQFRKLNKNKKHMQENMEEFNKIWKKVEDMVNEAIDFLLLHQEWGKYWNYSEKTSQAFKNYVKSFFPLYNNIWIKIRNV